LKNISAAGLVRAVSALRSKPLPLVDKDRRIVVLWSAKSACTSAYVWFASLCGFLDEVRRYADWPHAHRENVYNRSERYRESLAADTSGFHVLKIIRDPYTRAASIFRHAVRNRLVEKESLSFRDFLRMLSRIEIAEANIHFRPQLHPFERERGPDTVINLSKVDLFAELNALEGRMGWPVTDFATMTWLLELESARRPKRMTVKRVRYFDVPIVCAQSAKETAFPDDAAFLTPQARRLIERVYAEDFQAYSAHL